jgi:hypothetical protein
MLEEFEKNNPVTEKSKKKGKKKKEVEKYGPKRKK